jgi:hypothetical protein
MVFWKDDASEFLQLNRFPGVCDSYRPLFFQKDSLSYKPICDSFRTGVKMLTEALIDDSQHGQELRYVTTHFRDLQGLRMAPYWAVLMVMSSMESSITFRKWPLGFVALAFTAAQFGWLYWSGRWYEQRYGVVKNPDFPVRSGLISIMNPEKRPPRSPNYQQRYGQGAVLFLIWALGIMPDTFHRPGESSWRLILLLMAFQIVPRCFYPVTSNWSIRLRRIFSCAALLTIAGIYFSYRFARMDFWISLVLQLAILLSLDLYDHWLLNRLLSGKPVKEVT